MKSKKLCLILAPILLAVFMLNSMPEISAQETLFWTGNAYSATGESVSTPSLISGTEYRIVAATIFWYNYSGNLQADAQYYSADTSDYNWTNYYPAPNSHSFLQIDGTDVNWGSFSNGDTNHTYSISLIGTGNSITFQVYDWIDQDISNNYCHIEISIYQVSPSQTATPTPSASPTPSPTPTPTASPTPWPTFSPTQTPTPTPSPSPIPTSNPTATPEPTPITTPTVAPTNTPVSNQAISLSTLAYLLVLAVWTTDTVAFAIMLSLLFSFRRSSK